MQENALNAQIIINKKDEEIYNLIEKIKKFEKICTVKANLNPL